MLAEHFKTLGDKTGVIDYNIPKNGSLLDTLEVTTPKDKTDLFDLNINLTDVLENCNEMEA